MTIFLGFIALLIFLGSEIRNRPARYDPNLRGWRNDRAAFDKIIYDTTQEWDREKGRFNYDLGDLAKECNYRAINQKLLNTHILTPYGWKDPRIHLDFRKKWWEL